MTGLVYFAQAKNGPIKIGYSADVPRRLAQIARGMCQAVDLLATLPGDRRTEFYFHRVVREYRIMGEWFRPEPLVSQLVEAVKARGLDCVPPEYRPDKRGDPDGCSQISNECHGYIETIGGPRLGSVKVPEWLARVADLSDVSPREIKTLWYREQNTANAETYLKLREIAEGIEAARFDRQSPRWTAPWLEGENQ